MPTRYQAIALDLDGTLLDTIADLAAAANAMRMEMGLAAIDPARIASFVGGGMASLVHRALTDDHAGQADSTAHEQGLQSFQRYYDQMLADTSRPYPGVVAGLNAFRDMGLRLACVTNKPLRFTLPLLEKTGLAPYFSLTLGGDSLPEKKPSALPLLHVCREFSIPASALLMIGDSHYDLEAARNAHCDCVLLDYGYEDIRPLSADAHCGSLVEVLDFVKNAG